MEAKMDYREINLGYKVPKAGEFGDIIRFKIIQRDRIDIWPLNYQYFRRGHRNGISPVKNGFLKKEDNVATLVQSLYDDFFTSASNEFRDPNGAALELYGMEVPLTRRFLSASDLPRLKILLEKYLPQRFIPKFLKEKNSNVTSDDWWNYSKLWAEVFAEEK